MSPQQAGDSVRGRLRRAIRTRHYSPRTEKAYLYWAERFVAFHGGRHPARLGGPEVAAFLGDLAERQQDWCRGLWYRVESSHCGNVCSFGPQTIVEEV